MIDEQAEALQRAQCWCDEHGAEVRWDDDEVQCCIRVSTPGGDWIEGQGPGYYEAYVSCRARYDAANAPEGPPSWF